MALSEDSWQVCPELETHPAVWWWVWSVAMVTDCWRADGCETVCWCQICYFLSPQRIKGSQRSHGEYIKGLKRTLLLFLHFVFFLIPKSCTKFMIEILHFYALPPAGGRELLPQVLLFITLTCLLPSSAHPSQVGELWGKGVRMEEEAVKWEFLHSRVSLHLWMLLVIVFDYLLVLFLESVLRTEHLYENQPIALTLAHYQIFLFISEHYTALEARN